MDFETLINSPREVIEEYLEYPEELDEMNLENEQIIELIKATGNVDEYLTSQRLFDFGWLYEEEGIIVELIKATGHIEEYLTVEKLDELGLLNDEYIAELIKATGNVEKYLFDGQDINDPELKLSVANIIKATGYVEDYLTAEIIEELGIWDDDTIANLIKATGNVENYLTEEKLDELGILYNTSAIVDLIKTTGNVENYLTEEKLDELGISYNTSAIVDLIKTTGDIEKYLTAEKIEKLGLLYDRATITELIKATGDIEKYLTVEKLKELELLQDKKVIVKLIKATGNVEKYLTPEKVNEFGLLDNNAIVELIKSTDNPEKYLLAGQDINDPKLELNIVNIIKVTGNVEKYLTPEKVNEFGLLDNNAIIELIKLTNNPEKYLLAGQDINDRELQLDISNIIIATGDIEKYLTLEKLDELKMLHDYITITNLIKITPNPEKYLFEGQSLTDMLNICNVLKGTICQDLSRDELTMLVDFEVDTIKMVANMSSEKKKAAIKILNRLYKSNSAELRRISNQMALQILENSPEEYEKTLDTIENIYLTSNVPNVGKLYLVFKELHPNLLGENTKMQDASIGDIPSLNEATTSERKNIIFTSLLMSAVESNNRNLRNYIEMIEQGDDLFKKIRNSETKIENLTKQEKGIVTKYNELLNYLYNQSNKEEKRENTGDIEKDINELAKLFRMDDIERKMPDRLTRLFAHRAGIRSLAEAEKIMNESREKADKRNTELAEDGSIYIEEGDFVKGVADTEYFPSMLQRGILAKDFLGGNASSDGTPLDTDVEKVVKVGATLRETLDSLEIANNFTSQIEDEKNLGKIMLVFSKDNFIETRDEKGNVNKENIKLLETMSDKKEVCHNYGTAYGISVGIGSENIKCIIADRYVDKLGLEIALNGFYIPIVDNDGKVIYTKEMYESFREKMQGLSHYGEKHFELDETARKPKMSGIIELVDRSMQDARNKQEKILKTLEEAVNKNGYTISDERRTDLKPGIVEFIDTGSTGRGTNMPGDGDFDYMVRMDKVLSDNPTELKNSLREALRKN